MVSFQHTIALSAIYDFISCFNNTDIWICRVAYNTLMWQYRSLNTPHPWDRLVINYLWINFKRFLSNEPQASVCSVFYTIWPVAILSRGSRVYLLMSPLSMILTTWKTKTLSVQFSLLPTGTCLERNILCKVMLILYRRGCLVILYKVWLKGIVVLTYPYH